MSSTSPQRSEGPRRVRAVDHAIDVLEAMYQANAPVGVSQLSRTVGLSKGAIHHVLATLEARRFVMREPESALYKLGWALYEMGSSVVRSVDLLRSARPYLEHLASQVGETVLLGTLDNDAVLYIDRFEASGGLRMRADAGRRGPLHATASGKVLLAFATDGSLLERLLSQPLKKYTETTITEPGLLRHDLADIRHLDYATCWEEHEPDLSSIAAPLRDYRGLVVGSLAVGGPSSRMTPETLEQYIPHLFETVRLIKAHLGGTPAALGES